MGQVKAYWIKHRGDGIPRFHMFRKNREAIAGSKLMNVPVWEKKKQITVNLTYQVHGLWVSASSPWLYCGCPLRVNPLDRALELALKRFRDTLEPLAVCGSIPN